MSVAGDGHHIGPVVWLHGHTGGVGAGHVEGRGAAAVRALNARPRLPLPRVALAAVDAPLREAQGGESVQGGDTGCEAARALLAAL